MARLILLIAILIIGLLMWHKIRNATGEQRKKLVLWATLGALAAILLALAATGHLNWITAAIGGLIAFMPRLLSLLRYLPLIDRFRQHRQQQSGQYSGRQSGNATSSSAMSKQQAYEILGLKPGATKQEIIAAHKRMMQKIHPDRGGSDYLASQINEARKTLLQ